MANMKRRMPELAAGAPEIRHAPGMANEVLQELVPLLAEEGIDINNVDVPDMATLQAALNRATERSNMQRFVPVGEARDDAAVALRRSAEAIIEGDTALAATILDSLTPERPADRAGPTIAGCIGTGLGLLDSWLARGNQHTPPTLAEQVRLPQGHWTGEHAATDILTVARKHRAFRWTTLIARQGGERVLYGTALALAATIQTWSQLTDTSTPDLSRTHIR